MDRFLIEVLNEADLMPYVTGVTVPKLNQEKLRSIQMPLPPLEIQKEIVAEIEGYQKVINGARAVLDNYRPHIPINPDWPMVELATVARAKNGFAFKSEEYVSEGLRVMRIKNVQKGEVIDDDPKFMAASRVDEFAYKNVIFSSRNFF
jgi:type I restriction enzyme M protein